MASALNTVAKAIGQPIEMISADPVRLRPLLAGVTPTMARLSSGSWRTASSLLCAALAHLVGDFVPRRLDLAPSPDWGRCLDGVAVDRNGVFLIGRLARYATRLGVEPNEVDDALLARYLSDLTHKSLVGEPARIARKTIVLRNAIAARYPGWPQHRLAVPDNRVHRSLPWRAFPASLLEEIERWMDHLGLKPFADRDFRALRPASIASRRKYLAIYLGTLVEIGHVPAEMTSLASVITPDHARRVLEHIYDRTGQTLTVHLAGIAGLVLGLAKHWVKLEHAAIEEIRRMARGARPEQDGLAPRNEKRLAQLNDPRRMNAVLNLPGDMARQVERAGTPTIRLAHTLQTAVAIEIFLMTGLRIGNVASLEIGRTLLLRKDGGVDILLSRDEIKNRVAFTADLPVESARLIRRYISTFRPLLGDASSPWLFPGMRPNTSKTTGAIRKQVVKAMANVAGVAWHPHLFRHLLAHLQLEENPGSDGLVTRALGHKSADTTRSHYSGFQTKSAIRQHDALVLRLRDGAHKSRKGCRS